MMENIFTIIILQQWYWFWLWSDEQQVSRTFMGRDNTGDKLDKSGTAQFVPAAFAEFVKYVVCLEFEAKKLLQSNTSHGLHSQLQSRDTMQGLVEWPQGLAEEVHN